MNNSDCCREVLRDSAVSDEIIYFYEPASISSYLVLCTLFSDLYEGARIAKVTDFSGIRQLIQPLEESGTLVRRTDKDVSSSL